MEGRHQPATGATPEVSLKLSSKLRRKKLPVGRPKEPNDARFILVLLLRYASFSTNRRHAVIRKWERGGQSSPSRTISSGVHCACECCSLESFVMARVPLTGRIRRGADSHVQICSANSANVTRLSGPKFLRMRTMWPSGFKAPRC